MEPIYVFEHHQGVDIYFRKTDLELDEGYCPHCDAYDHLLHIYHDEQEFLQDLDVLLKTYGVMKALCDSDVLNQYPIMEMEVKHVHGVLSFR